MKIKELFEEWFGDCRINGLKKRTLERYRGVLDTHLLPFIGDKELSEVGRKELQALLRERRLQGCARGRGRGLSASSVNIIHSVLHMGFEYACDIGLMESNPCERVKRASAAGKKVEAFSREEQRRLERAIEKSGDRRLIGIILCLYTGLRIGELLALEWGDIDLRAGMLKVRKTVYRCKGEDGQSQVIVDTPKSASSERTVPLPLYITGILRNQKKSSVSDFVVENKKGERMSTRSYQYLFERLTVTAEVRMLNFHALRHTFATRAIESGMDVKTLSEIMGHSSAGITLNRYAHSMMENKIAVMRKLPRIG